MKKRKYLQRYPDGSIFFRKGGKVLGRLPDDEGSPQFAQEYDRLFATIGKTAKVGRPAAMHKPKTIKPTIGLFVERYRASDFFANPEKPHLKEKPLAKGTQYNYRLGLDLLHKQGVTSLAFSDLTSHKANLYIQKVKRERGGAAAAQQKILLSNLWTFARDFPDFDGGDRPNPMTGKEIKQPYSVAQEHEPWPEQVQEDFLAACDENLHLAFHLLICTGQRVSDVAAMKRSQYDGTHITLTQQKDRSKTPMTIKAPKLLRDVLAQKSKGSEYLLTHKWGRPYSAQSLSLRIREVLRVVGHSEYTTHGLRKNAGIMLAENGATVPQIMAALGHKTPKMALYYCRLANQKLLAEQASDILDLAFAKRAEGREGRVAARRNQIRRVR
jgi:integrase